MNKKYAIAASIVAFAIVSGVIFIGQTYSFQKKIDELSNMNVYDYNGKRVGIFECKVPWEKWPAADQDLCYRTFSRSQATVEYEVRQADSWTAFKSLLKTEGNIVGSIYYDQNARVIWFDVIRWDSPSSLTGTMITWFIPT